MTHGGTSIAMRRRLWVRGYCVSPSWNVHVDCVGATCTGYTLFNMVRICGAPSTRYFIFNHTRYLKHVRYSHRPGPVGPIWICADRACARMWDRYLPQHSTENRVHPDRAPPVPPRRRTEVHTDPRPRLPEYIHAFPRPVSISHVQPYTDSAAGRPDPDTRQRAVGYDTADRRMPVYHAVYTVQV